MVHPEPGSKRHAVRKGDPESPLYWVGNDEDWREVRRRPRVALECPERCGVELVSVENPAYLYAPRFFRVKPPRPACDHWEPPPGHGGPEGPQHDWLKNKLAEIARSLGYTAVVEHWRTRADVYVESSPPFCLEIQLRSTSFDTRTRARENHGAKVCWLIRDSLNTPSANEALTRAQAVRFQVIDGSRRVAQPWCDSASSVVSGTLRVMVFGTIAAAPRPQDLLRRGEAWFRMDGYLDAQQFLDEILSGRRRPYSGPGLGLRRAVWALDTDVADYRAFTKKMAERQASRPAPQQVQARATQSTRSGERTGDRPTARTPTDDRARAAIREQAATDLTQRIHQIEDRISELTEHKAKLAATGHPTDGPDRELGKLTAQLAILRRQNAILTERTAAAPRPPPSSPPKADPGPMSVPTERSPPANRPWWLRLLRRRNMSG
jgi:hypothetical protein